MRPQYWLVILIAAAGWGSGGIATRAAYGEGVGSWTMVGIRISLAALLVGVFLLFRRVQRPSPTVLLYGLSQAVFNLTIPYVLFTIAYGEASAGFVGILAAMIPLATALFANFLLPDEPLTLGKLVALFVSLSGIGVLLLSGDSGLSEGGRPLLAAGLALVAVASVGYAGTFAKRHAGEYEPITMTGLQFAFASVWLLVAMFAIEGVPTGISVKGWALMAEMAVFATFMPFLLFYWVVQHISATNVSLIGYIAPVFTLVGGIVLLGEELQTGIIVGGLLVFAGLVLTDRDSRRRAVVEEAITVEV